MFRLISPSRQSLWKTFYARMSMKPRVKEKQQSTGEKRKTGPSAQQEKTLANERLARQQWEKEIAEREAARALPQVPFSISGMYYAPWFAPKTYSLEDALAAHREFVASDMLDIADARLFIDATISMATVKKSEEEALRAKAAGAAEAGGKNVLQQFSARQLSLDDFNRVICTTDMVKEVSKMRVLFRDKLPSKTTETLCDTGGDPSALESLTRYHLLLSWSAEQLGANLQAYCQQLRETVSKRARDGGASLFVRMLLACPPSDERFAIEPPSTSALSTPATAVSPGATAQAADSERSPNVAADAEKAQTT